MINQLKSAFDEIAGQRGLPNEVVIDALQSALVSAYRRDSGASSAQEIEARIDPRTGRARIFVEKEVVDEIYSDATEVTLEKARFYEPEAQYGDTVMVQVEHTTKKFGRIAAQTAKQVILQKIREAERNSIYEEFILKEGDLVTGTVQNMNASVITITLGERAEGIMPRSQQIPGERYRPHEKVRVYIMEVKRGNRGPQIVCSRSHRNMLRKLLEYEVPEVYNGQVEIKSIAREAGYRSKVAVAALQDGVDPVGACVGMRGIRIQNIVKELHDEKIDVIEWVPEMVNFISKALSPARVSGVYLDDDLYEGRTAIVLVPDDQLSLAIGREGQNARLAAKLTGWRIDIKGITETAQGAIDNLDTPPLDQIPVSHPDLTEAVRKTVAKKAENKAIMPEEYGNLTKFANLVETTLQKLRDEMRREEREQIEAVRSTLPEELFRVPIDVLGLPRSIAGAIERFDNVGEIMLATLVDDPRLYDALQGMPDNTLDRIQSKLDDLMDADIDYDEFIPAEEDELDVDEAALQDVEEATMEAEAEAVEGIAEEVVEEATAEAEALDEPLPDEADDEAVSVTELEDVSEEREPEPAAVATSEAVEEDFEDEIDEDDDESGGDRRKRRRLVYDEETGEIVAKRRGKRRN